MRRDKRLVTIKLAAEILGISVATLRNWDKRKKLRAYRNPKNGYRLYNISELEKFAEKQQLRRKGRQKLSAY